MVTGGQMYKDNDNYNVWISTKNAVLQSAKKQLMFLTLCMIQIIWYHCDTFGREQSSHINHSLIIISEEEVKKSLFHL